MNKNLSLPSNFQAARLAAAGIHGRLMDKLPIIRRTGSKGKKNVTPHIKKI